MTDGSVILGAARTPIGAFLGGLAPLQAPELGAIAIKCAVERSGVAIDHPSPAATMATSASEASTSTRRGARMPRRRR